MSFIHFQELEIFLSIFIFHFSYPSPHRMFVLLLPGNFPAILNGSTAVCICIFALVLLLKFGLELREMQLNSMIIFTLILQLCDQTQTAGFIWNKWSCFYLRTKEGNWRQICMTRNPSEPRVISPPGSDKCFWVLIAKKSFTVTMQWEEQVLRKMVLNFKRTDQFRNGSKIILK